MMRTPKQIPAGLLAAAMLTLLSGCDRTNTNVEQPSPSPSAPVLTTPEPVPSATESPEVVLPIPIAAPEDIQTELYEAICQVRQPAPMEVSGLEWQYTPDMDVKNIYYGLLSQHSDLGYAYDVSAFEEGGILTCQVSYMPYKTGEYPEGRDYHSVSTFEELIALARKSMGTEPTPIRLTDSSWTPDQVNHALAQAGGGYILCALNRDGTEITYTPPVGMEIAECLSELEEVEGLADNVVAQVLSADMSEREKAFALYSYLTTRVTYDQRYYTNMAQMPYQSRTALGALRDETAICGGFSNAVQILFEKAGIPCYNVSGSSMGENHMWNIAFLDGQWLWFDATVDRGNSGEYGFLRFALEELDPAKYHWDSSDINMLVN